MKVLWLAWKDPSHPGAGGAEVVLWELSQRLLNDGHEVTVLTCGYEGAADRETVDGIDIIRVGTSRYIHPFQALFYYIRHLRNRYDKVIETVNTAPYFAVFFGRKSERFLFYHQMAREIWYEETKFPLNHIGFYFIEPVATWILGKAGVPTITVSESTRDDLLGFDFKADSIHIISEGIQLQPVKDLSKVTKYERPTLLSLGALRAMKRTEDQILAFEAAKASIPDLRLKIAGSKGDPYSEKVLQRVAASKYAKDIEYLGKVSQADKISLMQQCHLILVTSLKEGWGLIVTEANSQGTPAIVYNADGLRDSVRDEQTGIIVKPHPTAMAQAITEVMSDRAEYARLRQAAWEWSRDLTFDKSYSDFKGVIGVSS